MTDNPLDKLASIGQLLREKAAEIGLDMQTFLSVPDLSGEGVHVVQGMFVVNFVPPTDPATPDAQPDVDDVLAGIMKATVEVEREVAQEEKAEIAKARLLAMQEKLNRDGEGFLDDD